MYTRVLTYIQIVFIRKGDLLTSPCICMSSSPCSFYFTFAFLLLCFYPVTNTAFRYKAYRTTFWRVIKIKHIHRFGETPHSYQSFRVPSSCSLGSVGEQYYPRPCMRKMDLLISSLEALDPHPSLLHIYETAVIWALSLFSRSHN